MIECLLLMSSGVSLVYQGMRIGGIELHIGRSLS
jgi:hypothetical protein